MESLRRFKDDVKSVKQGYECGIGIAGYQDLKVGDTIEGYPVEGSRAHRVISVRRPHEPSSALKAPGIRPAPGAA